jgi:DNA primase
MSDFLDNTLYPALFERLDTALPEFNFRLKETGGRRVLVSRTDTRPDGHQGGESGKTFVSERSPFYLSDLNQVRGRSIWRYLKQRDSLDNRGVFSLLCDLAGVRPKRDLTPEALERIEAAQRRAELFEAVNAFLLNALHHDKSTGAEAARQYLKGRGLLLNELRQPEQELKDNYTGGERIEAGYYPGAEELRAHLEAAAQFTPEEIARAIPIPKAAGRLSLTLRERGRIIGFKFRSIDGTEPKYLNLEGYQKEAHLPGLTRGQEVIFVEGEFDQMTAHAAGFLQVVALGGSAISDKQIKAAINAGAQRLTLALDNDQAGQHATRRGVETLLRYLSQNGIETPVFVCTYPDGVKDLEELLRAPGGKETAQMVFNGRISAARYLARWLDNTRTEEVARETGGRYDTDLFREELLREIVHVERLLRPVDVPQFRQYIETLYKTYGFDADVIRAKADNLAELEAAKQYRQEAADLAERAAALFKEGKQEEAEEALKGVQEARNKAGAGQYQELYFVRTEAELRAQILNAPPTLQTPYFIEVDGRRQVLKLPAGGLSIFAARPGHGKSRALVNLALEVCRANPGEVHYFTFEESAEAVTLKALNCFLDRDLAGPQYDTNQEAIEAFFKGNEAAILADAKGHFEQEKAEFFRLIEARRLNIHFSELRAEALADAIRRLHRRGNVTAVFVDYIQLLNLEKLSRGINNRQEEVKAICNILKDVSRETGLPLVLAAQFNREVKGADDMTMSALREAGDIEQTAALIVGLWNRFKDEANPQPELEARVLKNRNGAPGGVGVWKYNGNRYRIYPTNTGATTGGNIPADVARLIDRSKK